MNPSQSIPTLEVLNSSWELSKSALGSNMEFSGISFQRNTEKTQPNPPKNKTQTTQSSRIRKMLFPALAAFLVGTNRISAGFGSLDPVRKLKLLDSGPSLTLEHNKYANKAFSGPTSTSTKLLERNEALREWSPREGARMKNLFSLKLWNSEHFRKKL